MATGIIPQSYQPLLPESLLKSPPSPLSSPEEYLKGQDFWPGLPFQPPPRRSSFGKRWRSLVYRTWFIEFVAFAVAFIFLIFALGLLALFNTRRINEVGTGMWSNTPNSTLNFFVSTMRTAMLLPVASGIAQLKWNWYQNRHSLADMEVYDDATGGVAGSLKLLLKPRFWYFTQASFCILWSYQE